MQRNKFTYLFIFIFSFTILAACGGGGGASNNEQSEFGELFITMTDAEGDFATYTVDILSIRLTRADGTEVETLPMNTRIDFAQYTEMTEFLTAVSIPSGIYVRGSIILDYSNADIQVEDATGKVVPVSQILDTNGNPITNYEVNVNLNGRNQLLIAPGIPKNLMIDFDLEQSHTVNFGEAVTINVDPVFIAELDPQTPRIHRVRGPLHSVDVDNNSLSLYIRPFYHRIGSDRHLFGSLNVLTNDNTVFEIDGVTYQGNDGLLTLNGKAQFSAVIVKGDLNFNPIQFIATEVYAGSSVPGGDMDVVRGTVTGRTIDDKIIIQGATLFRDDGAIVFNDYVTVQLDDTTSVSKQLELGTFNIDNISVGQRITVFGDITNDQVSDLQMSASNGYARMRMSSIYGDVTTLPAEETYLTMRLVSINGRNIDIYDFSGTGTDSGNDADPTNYEVDTSNLSLTGIVIDNAIAVRGFPTPFTTAPADYTAESVISE